MAQQFRLVKSYNLPRYILWLFVLLIFGVWIHFATLCQLSQSPLLLSTCVNMHGWVTSLVTLRVPSRLGLPSQAFLRMQTLLQSRRQPPQGAPVWATGYWNTNMARSRAVEAGQVRLLTPSLDATRVPRWHLWCSPWVLQLICPLRLCRQMPSSLEIPHLGSSDDLCDSSSEDHAMKET